MKTFNVTVAALVLLGLAQAGLAAPPRVKELGYEAASSQVSLPATVDGELTFLGCATCKVLRLRANANTRYVIGEQHVTLAEMQRYLARNPKVGMLVAQVNGTNDLSRVLIFVDAAN